jgi:hypothetical protein
MKKLLHNLRYCGETLLCIIGLVGLLTLASCNKTYNDAPFIPPKQTEQTVLQSFGMQIGNETTDLSRSWDKTAWVINFNQVPTIFTLTGTGASAGRNYSVTCTEGDLKAGNVSLTILPGTYTAKYHTIHNYLDMDTWVINGMNPAYIWSPPDNVMDIKINNDLTLTGTPIVLTAVLDDYLIIVDIPTVTSVGVYNVQNYVGTCSGLSPLLFNTFYASKGFHYAYINDVTNYELFPSNKIVSGTTFQNGNAYHVISAFAAVTTINIPDLIQQDVIVP